MMKFTRLALYEPYNCMTRKTFPRGSKMYAYVLARALKCGYKSEAWGTTWQIEQLKGKVRDGEEGVTVNWVGDTSSVVFNAEQLEDPSVFLSRLPPGGFTRRI